MKRIANFSSAVVVLAALNVAADDIALSTQIEAVTVHPRSALVTRQGQVQIPAGEHRVIVEGLPANLDPARLQFAIDSSALRLGSMELNQIHHGDYTEAAERQLREELQALQDDRKVISDRIDTANLQLQLLNSLASGGDNASLKPTVNGTELANLLSTLSQNSATARDAIRSANIELRQVDKAIEQQQFELDQIATQRKTQTQLIVNLRAEQPTTAPAVVIYPQANAYWRWLYEARLDTTEEQLVYNRQVSVVQNTGEDWRNVALTVTTADNRRRTQTPELNPVFVDLEPEMKAMPEPSPRDSDAFSSLMSAEPDVQEIVVTAARARDEATVVTTQYLVDYQIPGRVTVLANQQDKVLYVDNKSYDVDLVSRTVPERDKTAYLEARFTYEDEIPLQAGRLQMYRDGAFIGEGHSPTFLPGKDIRLPFGNDERIRVEIFNEAEGSKEGGIFNRSSVEQLRTRYEITSYHPNAIDVEVLARVPVAQNAKIEVEIPDSATAADTTDVDGKSGVIMWTLEAEPQQTYKVKHHVDIAYPKDEELQYREGR